MIKFQVHNLGAFGRGKVATNDDDDDDYNHDDDDNDDDNDDVRFPIHGTANSFVCSFSG